MKDTLLNQKNITNISFTIIGFLLLFSSIALFIYDYVIEQRAIYMSATVSELSINDSSSKNAIVKYSVNNEVYTKKIKISKSSGLTVGDQIKIKYDMYNPDKLIYNNHLVIVISVLILSVFLISISIKSTIKIVKNKGRINKLYKNGFYINADIFDVIINNSGRKIKKQLPYKLRCKYINPTDNTEYIFDSEDTYVNINEIIAMYNRKDIVVIIDKLDNTNYYVDLGSLYPKMNLIDPKEFMSSKPSDSKEEEKKEEVKNEDEVKEDSNGEVKEESKEEQTTKD